MKIAETKYIAVIIRPHSRPFFIPFLWLIPARTNADTNPLSPADTNANSEYIFKGMSANVIMKEKNSITIMKTAIPARTEKAVTKILFSQNEIFCLLRFTYITSPKPVREYI